MSRNRVAEMRRVIDTLTHLFVDDQGLAGFAIALIVLVAGGIKLAGLPPIWGGVLLVAGVAAILVESLQRATRKKRRAH